MRVPAIKNGLDKLVPEWEKEIEKLNQKLKVKQNFLLAFFHHSLIGFAYDWYMHLDKEDLRILVHHGPNLIERYFLKSLKDPCYNLMVAIPFKDFSQLVTVGEDIDLHTKERYESPFIGAHFNTEDKGEVNGIEGTHQGNSKKER
ncbi:uncharacterized protein G2W53_041158 [Senna tora]|uniref:Uncharacterized protein n=1 Tax=Senna tora TaxID=362788 RepID=A0A834SEX5_9FABA|nr:uncharacterized protein G2W53_041158 [Senna tora]